MKITASSQTLWKQGNFPFKKSGSQILMHSLKIHRHEQFYLYNAIVV